MYMVLHMHMYMYVHYASQSRCLSPSLFPLTEPTAPPQRVDIFSTSSHSFTMTWAPSPKGQQNGEIVSYAVEYREEGSNSTVVNTTRGMRYTAEDLTTDRVYQFRVAATTVNGTGPFSEWTEVVTIPTGNGGLYWCVSAYIHTVMCVRVGIYQPKRHSYVVGRWHS